MRDRQTQQTDREQEQRALEHKIITARVEITQERGTRQCSEEAKVKTTRGWGMESIYVGQL
jgi:hypothetical protein